MSKTRSIILSVVLEGRSQAETARRYDVTEAWVSILVRRYRTEGAAAFEARSRRPKTSPTKISEPTVNAIIDLRKTLSAQGLDAGPETIRWHLQQQDMPAPSVSTIRRYLVAAGLVVAEPKKRPKSSYIRFEAALPNETWQTDMCHWRLYNGADTEILSWLDDHSRYALSVTVHKRVNAPIVVQTFHQTAQTNGYPASVLFDNGRLRRDRIDNSGKITIRHKGTLYKIGIGRAHKRQPIIALIDNPDIRLINTQTGELLRQLTLDTTRTYQPQKPNT